MYIQPEDLQLQFGEAEMNALCDDGSGQMDIARLTQAIAQACSEADSYLGKSYMLPITPVPAILRCIIGDIVRYRLTSAGALETDLIVKRYQQAVGWLTNVAQGIIVLPVPTVNESENMVVIDAGERVWGVRSKKQSISNTILESSCWHR